MKPLFAYILLSLLFSSTGCQMKKESGESVKEKKEQNRTIAADQTSQTENDSLTLLPLDTLSTAKEIREIITSFRDKSVQELSGKEQLLLENMIGVWDSNDTVYIEMIAPTEDFIRIFKKYVFHSSRVVFYCQKASLPSEMIQSDTTQFFMHVQPNVYPPTVDQIEISITNHTQKELIAGEDYLMQYFDGTEWVYVPQNYNFYSLGHIIKPGTTRNFTVFLYPRLCPNRIGQYRVWKTVMAINKERNKHDNYALVATFFISDASLFHF